MTNKFFLIRVSLADDTRNLTDLTDTEAAEMIAQFAGQIYNANTEGQFKPMYAGHVIARDLALPVMTLIFRGHVIARDLSLKGALEQ